MSTEGGQRKTIVASGYKQVGSRATPEAIIKELRKLPASTGPLDARKRALHDLAHALAYVQEQHKTVVVDNCKSENAAGLLIQLLSDIDTAPPVPAGEDVIRVGRRVLGMGPMDARLYVLSCFVNLAYLGGAGQLRLPPDGLPYSAMEVLFDTLLITQDSESVLFYAVAGLYNLSNDASFAQARPSPTRPDYAIASFPPSPLTHTLSPLARSHPRPRLCPAAPLFPRQPSAVSPPWRADGRAQAWRLRQTHQTRREPQPRHCQVRPAPPPAIRARQALTPTRSRTFHPYAHPSSSSRRCVLARTTTCHMRPHALARFIERTALYSRTTLARTHAPRSGPEQLLVFARCRRYASGAVDNWRKHHSGAWPPQ